MSRRATHPCPRLPASCILDLRCMRRTQTTLAAPMSPRSATPTEHRLTEQVIERLREEIARKGFSQRDLAELLQWSQSRVAKFLSGRMALTLDALEAFCIILQLRPTEAVRDRGLEFCAEMTPGELRVFQILRSDPAALDALMTLLHVRTASPRRTRSGRPAKPLKAKLTG